MAWKLKLAAQLIILWWYVWLYYHEIHIVCWLYVIILDDNQKKHHTDWEEKDISKNKKGLILKLLKQVRWHAICSCKLYVHLTQLSAVSYSLNLLYFHWMYANKCNICYQEYFKHECIYNVTFLLIPWTLHQLLCFKETLEMPHLPGPHD
jgi:hypothetical protein